MDKFAREYLDMKQDKREVIAHPNIPYFGAMICDQSLVPNVNARTGSIRYDDCGNLRRSKNDMIDRRDALKKQPFSQLSHFGNDGKDTHWKNLTGWPYFYNIIFDGNFF